MKTVLVFGVFDKMHAGHIDFLKQARRHGGALVIVVARDAIVEKMKGKYPRWNETVRMEKVQHIDPAYRVVSGDEKLGLYSAVKKYKPNCICLGYDQNELKQDLEQKMQAGALPRIPLIQLKPHGPELYKSSLMA